MQKIVFFFFALCSFFSAIGQDSIRTVVAEQGDGIYALLRKHGLSPTKYYNAFIESNKDLLADEDVLKAGQYYTLPDTIQLQKIGKAVSERPAYPIFGDAFAQVDSLSNRLQGTVYYLVSGHGGPDPGAVGKYRGASIAEDEYAYDVTLRLARELLSHGATVFLIVRDENDGIRDTRVLTLDTDEVVYPDKKIPLNQSKRLKQRVNVINQLYKKHLGKYQRLIEVHVDSRSMGAAIDVFFYYHEKSKNGKRLAESIHQTFLKKYKRFQPNRGYRGTFEDRSGLYMVKNTLPAIAYIEIGNIHNEKDRKRILDPDNRQALAKWISEGVLLDYENFKR